MAVGLSVPTYAPVVLDTTRTVLISVGGTAGFFYKCESLIFVNTSAVPVTISLYKDTGAVSDAVAMMKAQNLAAGQTMLWDTIITLGAGQTLSALCSAAASVTATLNGMGKVT